MVMADQVRAARAVLRLTVAGLADLASVSPNTIVRVEADKGVHSATLLAIQRALEAAGIEFLDGDAPGIRWKL